MTGMKQQECMDEATGMKQQEYMVEAIEMKSVWLYPRGALTRHRITTNARCY